MNSSQLTWNFIVIKSKKKSISANNLIKIKSMISCLAKDSIIKSYSSINTSTAESSEPSPASSAIYKLIIELPCMTIMKAQKLTKKLEQISIKSTGQALNVDLMVANGQTFLQIEEGQILANCCKQIESQITNSDENNSSNPNSKTKKTEKASRNLCLEENQEMDPELKKILDPRRFNFPLKPKIRQLRITMLFQANLARYAQRYRHDIENLRFTLQKRE